MNAARLGRLLNEAGEDRGRRAEAICDEITDPSTGLVIRDFLDRRFAEFEIRFAQFEARFAQFETRFAELETRLTPSVIYTQVGGFVALAALILLK